MINSFDPKISENFPQIVCSKCYLPSTDKQVFLDIVYRGVRENLMHLSSFERKELEFIFT